jgi:hypothetical protein
MDAIADMFGPAASELSAMWRALPKEGLVPRRECFDPMLLPRILPVVTLFERTGEDNWRFRLGGSEIDRRWGRNVTGLDYKTLVEPELAPIILREFTHIVTTPCGSWSVLRVAFASGRWTEIEILRFPMRAKDGSVSLILCTAEEVSARIGHQPEVPSSVARVAEQRFIDIGAGLGNPNVPSTT